MVATKHLGPNSEVIALFYQSDHHLTIEVRGDCHVQSVVLLQHTLEQSSHICLINKSAKSDTLAENTKQQQCMLQHMHKGVWATNNKQP